MPVRRHAFLFHSAPQYDLIVLDRQSSASIRVETPPRSQNVLLPTTDQGADTFWDDAHAVYTEILDHIEEQALPFLQYCRFPKFFSFVSTGYFDPYAPDAHTKKSSENVV